MYNPHLTLLYTHRLHGDLALLPRLYTFMRYLRSLPVDDPDDVLLCAAQPVTRQVLIVDLGESCHASQWHCAATDGRSALITLDAMGYHAANVTELNATARAKLADQIQFAMIDPTHPATVQNVAFFIHDAPTYDAPPALAIDLAPAASATLDKNILRLQPLNAGQVGIAHVDGKTLRHSVETMPANTQPDPTIAATVDFVESEARYYSRKNAP